MFVNERDLVFLKHGSVLTLTHRAGREKAVKEHRSPSCSSNWWCVSVFDHKWWRRSVHFAVVLHVVPSWSAEVSEFVDGCDCNNNLSWMLHHIYHWTVPVSLPLMRCLWLSQQVVMEWRGFVCVCVCVVLYTGFPCLFLWLEPEAGSSAEAYISSVKLSSEKSLMEPHVVYLLISFKKRPSPLLLCPRQRSLCGGGHGEDGAESLTPPLHSLFQKLGVSPALFITVPLRESSSGDGPTVPFKLPWQTGLFHSSCCQSVIICSMLEHEADAHLVHIWNSGSWPSHAPPSPPSCLFHSMVYNY